MFKFVFKLFSSSIEVAAEGDRALDVARHAVFAALFALVLILAFLAMQGVAVV